MYRQIKDRFFPSRVATRPEIRRFVSGEASYLAQRATYEFSRNTLAWYGQHVLGDARFNEAFAICRWESFAAIAADMTFLVRASLAAGPDLDRPLLQVYADALAEYPNPVHRPQGWNDCYATLLSRFNGVADGKPVDLKAMGYRTGALVHGTTPVHTKSVEEERAVLGAAITFGLISFNDRLPRRLDPVGLVRTLAGQTAGQ